MDATLAVELWSAPVDRRQGFIEQFEVRTPVVSQQPVRRGAARTGELQLVVGRHTGTAEDDHLAWTDPTDHDEDLQLSRSQLRFRRDGHGWRVEVPGPERSRRSAVVRHWASSWSRRLEAGGPALHLGPGAHVCVAVTTETHCYWVLARTPTGPPPEHPDVVAGPGAGTQAGVDDPRPIENPEEWHRRRPLFPTQWQQAVAVRFRPYLTWPMDLEPALVEPRNFVHPDTGRADTTEAFQRSVKRRLIDTQAAAVARGFVPRLPSAVDERLLEWLVGVGLLTFEEHRLPWHLA